MSLLDIMKENEIDPNWIFTHARYKDNEGLFFFESVIHESEDEDVEDEHHFETKCLLIDGSKFVYGDAMEKEIEINTVNDNVVFNRVDGASVSLSKEDFAELPFRLTAFGTEPIVAAKPADYVEV